MRNEEGEFVRVLIGKAERNFNGVKKPIKTINLKETNVEEVYNLIMKALNIDVLDIKDLLE